MTITSISDLVKYQLNNLDLRITNSFNTTIYCKAKIIKKHYLLLHDIEHINLWAPNDAENQGCLTVSTDKYIGSDQLKSLFGQNFILFSLTKKFSLSLCVSQENTKKIKFSKSKKQIIIPFVQNSPHDRKILLEDYDCGNITITFDHHVAKHEFYDTSSSSCEKTKEFIKETKKSLSRYGNLPDDQQCCYNQLLFNEKNSTHCNTIKNNSNSSNSNKIKYISCKTQSVSNTDTSPKYC